MNGLPLWLYLLMVVGPPAGGYVLMLVVFRMLARLDDRRERRRGGTLDLTYLSRSVDRRPRLYDQELDVDGAIALSEELRDIAREARG